MSHPIELVHIAYYYQPANAQPEASRIPKGWERVEIFTGGRGWVEIEGIWTEVTKGALLWHIEGDMTTARSDPANPYRCVNIQMLMNRRESRRRAPRLSWWRDREEIERFANEAIRCHVDDSFDRDALLAHVYGRLIFQVRLAERAGQHEEFPSPIRQALNVIEERYRSPLRLQEIAKAAGWSVPHLHEVFRRFLDMSPHQALLQKRLHRARELLSSTDLSVKQVAGETGFSTAAGFSHSFKSRVGLTPREFRLQVSGQGP